MMKGGLGQTNQLPRQTYTHTVTNWGDLVNDGSDRYKHYVVWEC